MLKVCVYESAINGVPVFIRNAREGWMIFSRLGHRRALGVRWGYHLDYVHEEPREETPTTPKVFATPEAANEWITRYQSQHPLPADLAESLLRDTVPGRYDHPELEEMQRFLKVYPDAGLFVQKLIQDVAQRTPLKVSLSIYNDEGSLSLRVGLPRCCEDMDEAVQDYEETVSLEWRYSDD